MERKEFLAQLEEAGVQVQQSLGRFMGNEDLFLSFLSRLPEQLRFEQILQSMADGDEENFYLHIHNLKGMAGNLGLAPIYDCSQAILVEFRTSRFQHANKLTALIQEAKRESEQLSVLIEQYRREEGQS